MHDSERTLARDLASMSIPPHRRQVLALLVSAVGLGLVRCAGGGSSGKGDDSGDSGGGDSGAGDSGSGDTASGDTAAWSDSCVAIPEETEGPYPGDGSNGPNALGLEAITRSDIRTSVGSSSGTAAGVPLQIRLRLMSAETCTPLVGYAIYVWHCTQDGLYSMYTDPDENYLRGVQVTDDDGVVSFTSIFPGCYSGRWPHVHFEIYPSLEAISSARNKAATSQLALPEADCEEVYATEGYESSATNLDRISLATDNVFNDGWTSQLAEVTGDVESGYVATLQVSV